MDEERVGKLLKRAAKDGARRAERGLGRLVGQHITVEVPSIRFGTKWDACDALGGAEQVALGAYFEVDGDFAGHVMLLFPERQALDCVDLMSGNSPGTATLDDLAESAITELGNIVGSAFVNALADTAALTLQPSPPVLVHDMAMALIESVYAEILISGNDIVILDTLFEDRAGRTAGLLIVAPDAAALQKLEALAA